MARLTISEASTIAHRWVDEQADLPQERLTMRRSYHQKVGGRLFTVIHTVAASGCILRLMEFYVLDDRSVRMRSDRRTCLKAFYTDAAQEDDGHHDGAPMVSAKEKMRAALERFFLALNVRTASTPSWFLRVEPSDGLLNSRGIGVLAYVDCGGKYLKVPMEIKCSCAAERNFYEKHPLFRCWNIGVVIVNDGYSDDSIRIQVYTILGDARRKGERYTEFFRELFTR